MCVHLETLNNYYAYLRIQYLRISMSIEHIQLINIIETVILLYVLTANLILIPYILIKIILDEQTKSNSTYL